MCAAVPDSGVWVTWVTLFNISVAGYKTHLQSKNCGDGASCLAGARSGIVAAANQPAG